MLAPPQDLLRSGLRTGVGLKVNRAKRAVSSYFGDRTQQATDTVKSHVIAYAMYAAAGVPFEVVPGVGHSFPVEDPKRFVTRVLNFALGAG